MRLIKWNNKTKEYEPYKIQMIGMLKHIVKIWVQ
jgi:hypothetical protein